MSNFIAKKVQYFIQVAQKKSIVHAADDLCITYSPLYKIIKELEKDLGKKLFFKKDNLLELTEFGKHLYEALHPLYQTLDSLESTLFRRKKNYFVTFIVDEQCPDFISHQIISLNKNIHFDNILHESIDESTLCSTLNNYSNSAIISLNHFTHDKMISSIELISVECCLAIPCKYKDQPISETIKELPILQNASNKIMHTLISIISDSLIENKIAPTITTSKHDIATNLELIAKGGYIGIFPKKIVSFINHPGVCFTEPDHKKLRLPYKAYFLTSNAKQIEEICTQLK